MTNERDIFFMRRALELAERGSGWTAPNPIVGAVLVKDDVVIGEGWHARYGDVHAEVAALSDAKKNGYDPHGSALYVSLEPCNHAGLQPPCTKAILEAGITTVVFAAYDPNPDVVGRGAKKLTNAGLTVRGGVLEAEARYQNRVFFHWITTKHPYVCVKVAVSSDNKLTRTVGTRTMVSGPEAWEFSQSLRQHFDAVLVGAHTITIDDPELTVRSTKLATPPRQPLRVIIDGNLTTPPSAKVCHGGHTLILTSTAAPREKIDALPNKVTVALLPTTNNKLTMKVILAELEKRGITSVLVEGGAHILEQFFEEDAVDEWLIIRSQATFGEGLNFMPQPEKLTQKFSLQNTTTLGNDRLERYVPRQPLQNS